MTKDPIAVTALWFFKKLRAHSWKFLYLALQGTSQTYYRHRRALVVIMGLIALMTTVFFSDELQLLLASHFKEDKQIESLQGVVLNIGSALVGAAAIVTSLVLFAMQVNIERMPHGLFHRLSADTKLLFSFALAFVLALFVATLSTVVAKDRLACVVLAVFWSIAAILLSFLYAYRRALVLVNPVRQLDILIADTRQYFTAVGNRATRLSPLFEIGIENNSGDGFDIGRRRFFDINPQWDDRGLQAMKHAMSYAQRYTEQGDYEVAGYALYSLVEINKLYMKTKGNTFFPNNGFIDSRDSLDKFITQTLESLRLLLELGISKRDERQLSQAMQTLVDLSRAYLNLSYSSPAHPKHHALLAARYLIDTLNEVVNHEMPDVLVSGQRYLGLLAKSMIRQTHPEQMTQLTDAITSIALTGILQEKNRPSMQTGVVQLAELTILLIMDGERDVTYPLETVRNQAFSIAKTAQSIRVNSTSTFHQTTFSSYFSYGTAGSLPLQLTEIANRLLSVSADSQEAKDVIKNIVCWAEGINQKTRELLLLSISASSPFVLDVITWICQTAVILVTMSKSSACDAHDESRLQRHAKALLQVFTFAPETTAELSFLTNYALVENLFEAGESASSRECPAVVEAAQDSLISWGIKCGQYPQHSSIMERSLIATALLAQMEGPYSVARIKQRISEKLTTQQVLSSDVAETIASSLTTYAHDLPGKRTRLSDIDGALQHVDINEFHPLLLEIATILFAARHVPDRREVP